MVKLISFRFEIISLFKSELHNSFLDLSFLRQAKSLNVEISCNFGTLIVEVVKSPKFIVSCSNFITSFLLLSFFEEIICPLNKNNLFFSTTPFSLSCYFSIL